jgi:hypothetical protein
MECASA